MRTSIPVKNVMCDGCCNTIRTALSNMEKISNVDVDLATTTVSFDYHNASDVTKVKEKLKTIGYPYQEKSNSSESKSFFGRITDKFAK